MPAIYPFQLDQEDGSQNADYTFTTKLDVQHSVSFTEITRIIDIFDNYPVLSNGVYLVVEPVNPPDKIIFDSNTGITIAAIFEHYLNNTDLNSIIIFNCEERDGKQLKRHNIFERWFKNYLNENDLLKLNKVILMPQTDAQKGLIYIPGYISILFRSIHPRYKNIIAEIASASDAFNTGKPDAPTLV